MWKGLPFWRMLQGSVLHQSCIELLQRHDLYFAQHHPELRELRQAVRERRSMLQRRLHAAWHERQLQNLWRCLPTGNDLGKHRHWRSDHHGCLRLQKQSMQLPTQFRLV